MAMPSSTKAGRTWSSNTRACLAISSWATRRGLFENLTRFQTGRGAHGQAGRDPSLEAGHPDHEELVEAVGEDGEIAGPFQQRHRFVGSKLQDSLVELQPGDLTVEKAVI